MSNDTISILSNLRVAGSLSIDKDVGEFPSNPRVGMLVLKGTELFAYLTISGMNTWFPLVRSLSSIKVHTQAMGSFVWTVTTEFDNSNVWYQIKDTTGRIISEYSANKIDNHTIELTFTELVSGTVIVVGVTDLDVSVIKTDLIKVGANVIIDTDGMMINGQRVLTAVTLKIGDGTSTKITYLNTQQLNIAAGVGVELNFDDAAKKITINAPGASVTPAVMSAAIDAAIATIPPPSDNIAGNAATATSVNWSGVVGTPTTLSAYGVVDAHPLGGTLANDLVTNALTVGGDILPDNTNGPRSIGSAVNPFSAIYVNDAHVGLNTLYLGETPFLGTYPDGAIKLEGSSGQSVNLTTGGIGAKVNLTSDDSVVLTAPVTIITGDQIVNGGHSVNADLIVGGNIIPNLSSIQDIGSPTNRFRNLYVDEAHLSVNTLYLGDTPILGTSNDTVNIHADVNQSINIHTAGTGNTLVTSDRGVVVSTSGQNADVLVQATGAGSLARISSPSEVRLTAPEIITTGNSTVSGSQFIGGNLNVTGNVTLNGSVFTVNSTTVTTIDNIIQVNKGQVGSGVTAGSAGLSVDRGDSPVYQMVFDEVDDMFKVGMVGQLEIIASQNFVTAAVAAEVINRNAAQAAAIAASTPVAHVGSGDAAHAAVTTSVNGFMIAADKVKLDAVTGTNTGDESAATIKSKLGITTLSGSNTGDQTNISGNAATATVASSVLSALCAQNGDGWWRSTGAAGWYSTSYSSGIHATEAGIVSTYNNSNFRITGTSLFTAGAASSYGAISIKGSQNGWGGINFKDAAGTTNYCTLMMGTAHNGVFNNADSGWSWLCDNAGNFTASGNLTAYSDPRLKENFTVISKPFDILDKLDGGTFTWKHDIPHTWSKAGKRDYGVLADQVEAVMPEIVTESIEIDEVSYKTVAYEKLIPVLLEAVKELKAEIDSLKAEVAELRK